MVTTKTYSYIGLLMIVFVALGTVYISMSGEVRIRIDNNQAIFYVNESRWLIAAVQEDRLFAGTSIIDRVINTIERKNYTENDFRIEYRFTGYENNESIIHTWKFDPYTKSIEEFPIEEKICISNAKGKFYRYSLKKLYDPGPKRKLIGETSASFGRNMKITFEPDYSWAWIGWPYGAASFAVQYKIKSDYECFDVRLFDPPVRDYSITNHKSCIIEQEVDYYDPIYEDVTMACNLNESCDTRVVSRIKMGDTPIYKNVCDRDTSYIEYYINEKKQIFNYSKLGYTCTGISGKCDRARLVDGKRGDSNGDGICTFGEDCIIIDFRTAKKETKQYLER